METLNAFIYDIQRNIPETTEWDVVCALTHSPDLVYSLDLYLMDLHGDLDIQDGQFVEV